MIVIIGMGALGKCIFNMLKCSCKGLVRNPEKIIQLEKEFKELKEFKVYPNTFTDDWDIINSAQVIIITVKPLQVSAVCEQIKNRNFTGTVISCAAAVSLKFLRSQLLTSKESSNTITLVRCMPNILCQYYSSVVPYITEDDLPNQTFETIFAPNKLIHLLGENKDADLDLCTVISGCGPAFNSFFANIMKNFIVKFKESSMNSLESSMNFKKSSLSEKDITLMLSQSMIGTGLLLKTQTPKEIINQVASIGGATEAALKILDTNNLEDALFEAYNRIDNIKNFL